MFSYYTCREKKKQIQYKKKLDLQEFYIGALLDVKTSSDVFFPIQTEMRLEFRNPGVIYKSDFIRVNYALTLQV